MGLKGLGEDDFVLVVKVLGKMLFNLIGLVVGFDKNVDVFDVVFGMGFGFVEVGMVMFFV